MRGLVFDLDGTLVDSAPDMAAAMGRVLAAQGFAPVPLAAIRGFIGNGVPELVRRVMATVQADPEGFDAWHHAYLEEYAASVCVETVLYPGVREALDALKAHPMAICTNKPQALSDALVSALALPFAVVLGGDTPVGRKPDAAPLRTVAERLGVREAVMIGDSAIDAAAARAAGWPILLYEYGYRDKSVTEIAPDASFADWSQLPALVRSLG